MINKNYCIFTQNHEINTTILLPACIILYICNENSKNQAMIKRLFGFLLPPEKYKIRIIILSAVFLGIGFYTMYVSKFHSYLSDSPEACVNCHIMTPQYTTWSKSSHHNVASCNDCHVPHNNVLNKYYFKAKDGLRHATLFTFRMERQVIQIQDESAEVVQKNCERCHSQTLESVKKCTKEEGKLKENDERKCWECHRETPHGRVNSLSSTPHTRVQSTLSPIPVWLKQKIEKEQENVNKK